MTFRNSGVILRSCLLLSLFFSMCTAQCNYCEADDYYEDHEYYPNDGGFPVFDDRDGVQHFALRNDPVDVIHFDGFYLDGPDTYIVYEDGRGSDLRTPVPRYFLTDFSKERLKAELQYYFGSLGDPYWSERVLLELLYFALVYGTDHKPEGAFTLELETDGHWLDENFHICDWQGVVCGPLQYEDVVDFEKDNGVVFRFDGNYHMYWGTLPLEDVVTSIALPEQDFQGTLPFVLDQFQYLEHLNLRNNRLRGTIPDEFGDFANLRFLDLSHNQLTGTIPARLGLVVTLEEVSLEGNLLEGPLPYTMTMLTNLRYLNLGSNNLLGTIPPEIGRWPRLVLLQLKENTMIGEMVTQLGQLKKLRYLDLSTNRLTGGIPSELGLCTELDILTLSQNPIGGHIPTELFRLHFLRDLRLSKMDLTGTIPTGDDRHGHELGHEYSWSNFRSLTSLAMEKNYLTGSVPPELATGLAPTLETLSIIENKLTGTLPTEMGRMTLLKSLFAHSNQLTGQLPSEMGLLPNPEGLWLVRNRFTGTVPSGLCSGQSWTLQNFGCDAILCPPGTFHKLGGVTREGACQPCPDLSEGEDSKLLGQTKCATRTFLRGDLNADGELSPSEILRLLYFHTGGMLWGEKFFPWSDLGIHACSFPGVTCTVARDEDDNVRQVVAKIDLSDATMCSNGNGQPSESKVCRELPKELSLLSDLEVLQIARQPFLRGTIPSEFGLLRSLRYLEISGAKDMTGTIPSELGLLSNLEHLKIMDGSFNGTIPSELFSLEKLEKINLGENSLSGSIPNLEGLQLLKELAMSRNFLNGTIPSSIGSLSAIENMELYSNELSGTLPESLGKCTALRRIDIFNNNLEGSIPDSVKDLEMLQVLHVKNNQLTGILPDIGSLPYLVWVDATDNFLEGTISSSYGKSSSLKDIRLSGNRFYGTIPQSLCTNTKINGGRTGKFGCDAILCPIGRYSSSGFASDTEPCLECPPGETSIYLGGKSCIPFGLKDMLSMFFDVMHGESWPEDRKRGWKDDSVPLCAWEGITCDVNGEIIGLSFPVQGTDMH